jgi:hypothetical protein
MRLAQEASTIKVPYRLKAHLLNSIFVHVRPCMCSMSSKHWHVW